MKIKNKNINKCFNIIKKINGCLECHIKNINNKNIIKKNIIHNYNKLLKFKNKKKYNLYMNSLIKNLKNKYMLEICKYVKKLIKFKNYLLIK